MSRPRGRSVGTGRSSASVRAAGASFWMAASSPSTSARVPRWSRAVVPVSASSVPAAWSRRGPPSFFEWRASFLSVVDCASQGCPSALCRVCAASAKDTDSSHSSTTLLTVVRVRTGVDIKPYRPEKLSGNGPSLSHSAPGDATREPPRVLYFDADPCKIGLFYESLRSIAGSSPQRSAYLSLSWPPESHRTGSDTALMFPDVTLVARGRSKGPTCRKFLGYEKPPADDEKRRCGFAH